MELFDLAIIGGGPAGYRAAERAVAGKLKTVLFERRALGGVCLNEGCIPTKALLNCAKIYTAARDGARFGVKAEGLSFDHGAAMAHKNRVVKTLVGGVESKMKKGGVTVVSAQAKLAGRGEQGFLVEAGGQTYAAKQVLLAAGSAPVLPPIPGLKEALESGIAVTSGAMLEQTQVPERLIVIGGGVIGLEMASYYHEAGAHVEVVEMLQRIGGPIDEKLSAILQKALEKSGVKFHLGAKVTALDGGKVTFERDGAATALEADRVLVSIGRRADTAGLGLESLNIATERGAVLTDAKGRTNVGGVFAAGDINGKSMLAHTAYREAELAVNTMLGIEDAMDYDRIPAVIYTHPEVATVGLTADAARQRGMEIEVVELPLRYSGRYIAENPSGNDICIVVADKKSRKLLGVHLCGNYASEIIYGAAALLERGARVDDIRKIVFPHPTVSEVLREAAFEF